ncbi:peptidase T [Sporosarcina gallistercoris]|uniref:Peptidase T n=1 Tax=Sporosarcina gallistercoris TaxID=2762245 RepID=A0ABR8PKU7_9BACL|nr:peptidase T [Sporosarcina gallistercoris]MBD7908774.1 peptidase T [Sporosarcina gallistercoris]
MKEQLLERFIRYAKIDTESDEKSQTTPSTTNQWDLLHLLKEELSTLGMEEITLDENGYLFATLPANTDKEIPVIGFLAHVDTSPDFTGKNVNPQRHDNYDGSDLVLNEDTTLSVSRFPELQNYIGQTLITTDGTTLLGADDKAGIAEIMTAMAYFQEHPEVKHGKLRVAFTPDEEIGRGPHKFDVDAFGVDFAYTMDGGPLGELQYESFNAAGARVTFKGTNVHPGTAKGKMINSILRAQEFQAAMPALEIPELTDGREGFIHLMDIQGSVEKTVLDYIIRDFDRDSYEARKKLFFDTVAQMRSDYGEEAVVLELEDQYFNMGEKIMPHMEIVDIISEAFSNLGITPIVEPIRGGTDGSQLSYMGIPTPNIFAGGENFHGRYEFVSAETMEKAAQVIIETVKLYESRA